MLPGSLPFEGKIEISSCVIFQIAIVSPFPIADSREEIKVLVRKDIREVK